MNQSKHFIIFGLDNCIYETILIVPHYFIVNFTDPNFIFPDGTSQLRDTSIKSPNVFKIIQRGNASCDNDFFDRTRHLEHKFFELSFGKTFQFSLRVPECDTDCLDSSSTQLPNLFYKIPLGIDSSPVSENLIFLVY